MHRNATPTNALFRKKDADPKSPKQEDFEQIPLSMLPKEFTNNDLAKLKTEEISSKVDGSILLFLDRGNPHELDEKIKQMVVKKGIAQVKP